MGAQIPVHGHRGARMLLPENTLPAFEYAVGQGADWIELDLWVTRDNVLVVSHDPDMNPKFCRGPADSEKLIRNMTLPQLKQWDCGAANPDYPRQKAIPGTRIPTFEELLSISSKGSFHFNVEMKSDPKRPELTPPADDYVRMVIAAIRKHKLEKRVMIQSFDWRLVEATAKLAPELARSALFPTAGQDPGMDFTEIARAAGVKRISVQYNTVTPEKVTQAHAAGITVIAWTANTPEVWQRLLAAKVDEVITDDPAGLIRYLKSKGLH